MKSFKIDEHIEIVCEWKRTRTAFKHEATLLIDGMEQDKTKICYVNRTWERYEFESVLFELVKNTKKLTAEQKELAIKYIKDYQDNDPIFGLLSKIARIGDVICENQKEKNDWKARMLKAGLGNYGLDIPEDWETLSEDEKEKRLNGAIQQLS